MNVVFVDTVGFIALWNKSDQWHSAAKAAFSGLTATRTTLVTTTWVFVECGNAAARQPYRRTVATTRREMAAAGKLLEPSLAEIEEAWNAFEQGAPGSATIVDLISFGVMRRAGLTRALTNDAHFRAAGLETLF